MSVYVHILRGVHGSGRLGLGLCLTWTRPVAVRWVKTEPETDLECLLDWPVRAVSGFELYQSVSSFIAGDIILVVSVEI